MAHSMVRYLQKYKPLVIKMCVSMLGNYSGSSDICWQAFAICYSDIVTSVPSTSLQQSGLLTPKQPREHIYRDQCRDDSVNGASDQLEAVSVVVLCKTVTNKCEDGHSIVQQVFLNHTHTTTRTQPTPACTTSVICSTSLQQRTYP